MLRANQAPFLFLSPTNGTVFACRTGRMCIFQWHFFLCGAMKIRISRPCSNTSTNAQGDVFCRNDPHPHELDGNVTRVYDLPSHGPGVCQNIHCHWTWGLLPKGEFEKLGTPALNENDAAFDMSDEACAEREDRWFRTVLSTDQQLECLGLQFPLPTGEARSLYAQAYFDPDFSRATGVLLSRFDELSTEQLHWSELNPRYMNAEQLRHATGYLLPASVTVPGSAETNGTTPHMPCTGPSKFGAHVCRPAKGICRVCGRNHGSEKELTKQENAYLEEMLHEGEKLLRPQHYIPVAHRYLVQQGGVEVRTQTIAEADQEMAGEIMPEAAAARDDDGENLAARLEDMDIDFGF